MKQNMHFSYLDLHADVHRYNQITSFCFIA